MVGLVKESLRGLVVEHLLIDGAAIAVHQLIPALFVPLCEILLGQRLSVLVVCELQQSIEWHAEMRRQGVLLSVVGDH